MSTHFAQPSNAAPAGDQNNPAPAPKTNATQGTPEAPPQGGGGGGGFGGITPILMLLPILLIFMTMRGQTKKQKQLESSLKTGDTVVTQSGVIGKITEMGENRVKIEIAPGVNVRMLKSAIQGVDGGDAKPAETKDGKEKQTEKKA